MNLKVKESKALQSAKNTFATLKKEYLTKQEFEKYERNTFLCAKMDLDNLSLDRVSLAIVLDSSNLKIVKVPKFLGYIIKMAIPSNAMTDAKTLLYDKYSEEYISKNGLKECIYMMVNNSDPSNSSANDEGITVDFYAINNKNQYIKL